MHTVPKPYSPDREDAATLEARTVGRRDLLAVLLDRFRVAATVGTLQHTLLVGPRGAGKTHAVEVALHRLAREPSTAGRFRVARLPEDMVGIASVADLLLAIVERLDPGSGTVDPARDRRRSADETGLERLVLDLLGDDILVLVAENLDRLFYAIGRAGQHALRSWVETSRQVLVVATSPLLLRALRSRSEPWFGSFVVERLDPLSLDEAAALVADLAGRRGGDDVARYVATAEGRDRLATVQQLAGGSPRIWTMFADLVTVCRLEQLTPAIEDLLEGLVPAFQQRLWELAPSEQKLVLALASPELANAPVRVVAERAGLEVGTAGVTLRRLEESGWVRGQKMPGTDQRSTWYELREPLLRHYLQYRQGDRTTLGRTVELLRACSGPCPERAPVDLGCDANAFGRLPSELREALAAAAPP